MEIEIEFAGEIVERQELLNGTETVSLEGQSDDGRWTMSGLLTWNIGLVSNAGEGDITLARDDGAEVFATVMRGDVSETTPGDDGDAADHAFRVEYEIDGGSGAFASASGTCDASGGLAGAGFRGRWTLRLRGVGP